VGTIPAVKPVADVEVLPLLGTDCSLIGLVLPCGADFFRRDSI
jgi:hypothetical protein